MSEQNPGATREEWSHFSHILGLTQDLLPVVSDSSVAISSNSKMKQVGKTPSVVNKFGHAVGVSEWTSKVATSREVKIWANDPRLGICIQTRHIRALDIDVDDPTEAAKILETIQVAYPALPIRSRPNSNKRLLILNLPGDYTKRIIRTQHGIIEFLATGQQFIAAGTHTSGVKYEWLPELPDAIPDADPEAFEALWSSLQDLFGVEEATTTKATVNKKAQIENAITQDPISVHLIDNDYVLSTERDGRLHITCPFESEHTEGTGAESATTYFPANTGGFAQGHFRCLHAHCQNRSDEEFKTAVGYDVLEFEDISDQPDHVPPSTSNPGRFTPVHVAEFALSNPPTWIIKNVLPQAEVAVMFGDSGSGKSFMALDMVAAVALNEPWRGCKVKQTNVAYIAAEGAGGFKKRIAAYASAHDLALKDIPLFVIPAAPNFLEKKDAIDVAAALNEAGQFGLVVVDTWAQTTAGGNENSGEDMGKALRHCKIIHQQTGAMIMLIHHSGKNASQGARGWSGLRAAADVEFEVVRTNDDRSLSITKQKDGEEGSDFGFRLRVVPIGIDEDGDVITSCVVDESQVSVHAQRQFLKLGNNEKLVLRVARDNISMEGVCPDVNTVLAEAVAQMEYDPMTTKHDKRKQSATRAFDALKAKGMIFEIDGRVSVKREEVADDGDDQTD